MPDQKFSMADYVPVNERIGAFLAKHPDGSLQSELIELSESRVVMRAYAYRSPEDPRPGIGYSSLEIPGRTPYTRGSEVENAETSAWGRAIAALGFEVKRGIASAEEVRNKSEEDRPRSAVSSETRTPEGGLVGTAIAQGTQDFELRQSPDGWRLPFRVKDGSKSFIVVAENDIAQALATIKDTVVGERVTVWGHWSDETIPKRGDKPAITYRVLHLERIGTPDGILPAPAFDSKPEALPDPIFDESEMAVIDAALDKVPA